jgi:hypothetical protein
MGDYSNRIETFYCVYDDFEKTCTDLKSNSVNLVDIDGNEFLMKG